MNSQIESVCEALDQLAARVLACWGDDRTLKEVHGWHHVALTRHDLAAVASQLAKELRNAGPEIVDSEIEKILADMPRRLNLLHGDTIPQMFNGHGHQAVPAYMDTIAGLRQIVEPLIGWRKVGDRGLIPASMAQRLRKYQAIIDSLAPNTESLRAQIAQIQQATEAADHLPTDLEDLAAAKKNVDKIATDAAELYGKLDERGGKITELLEKIESHEESAAKLVAKCEDAYRITTTKGLAAAFDQRASDIAFSMWVWVGGLLLSLVAATLLGAERVKLLTGAMQGADPQWGIILMHVLLSVLSVGAPLWFGWVATKQISQRFRIAEDYGFKASVAKAYEGYRKEAERLDPVLEKRLFGSALSRLEEAPLRLVATEKDHGSPVSEFMNSPIVRDAIKVIPDFSEKVIALAGKSLSGVRGVRGERGVDSQTASSSS